MALWRGRLIRLWIVLLLPAAIYCGYKSIEAHQLNKKFQEHAEYWQNELLKPEPNSIVDPKEFFDRAINMRDRSESERGIFGVAAALLLFFPLEALLLCKTASWVWSRRTRFD